MAEVANSVSASSPPPGGNKGHPLEPDSPDLTMLSPGVQEAMNRIFSNSSSLLSEMPSLESKEDSSDTLTTKVSGEEKSTSSSGESNAVSSLTKTGDIARAESPIVPMEASPVIPPTEHTLKNKAPSTDKSEQSEKKQSGKGRISKADFEIITSLQQNLETSSQSSNSQTNCVNDLASDGISEATSDSEDMCRVFATAAKERKKENKKKKKRDLGVDKVSVLEMGGDSEEEFQNNKRNRKTRNDVNLNETNLKQRVVMKALEEESISWKDALKKSSYCRRKSVETDAVNPDVNSTTETINSSDVDVVKITPQSSELNLSNSVVSMLNKNSKVDNVPGGGDMSNSSTSSAKENLPCSLPCKAFSGIKLPRAKKASYFLSEQKNIMKTFPPCYVVVKSLGFIRSWCKLRHWAPLEAVLPLSVRMDFLKRRCDSGSDHIKCRRRKKRKQKEVILDPSHMIETGQSEEEFEVSRGGRSLRKRNQKISYKEPSEFMIEYREEDGSSSKRPRNRSKSPDWTEDDALENRKKKRKVDPAVQENPVKEKNYANQNYLEKKNANGQTQVIVYPKTSTVADVSTGQKQFPSWAEQRSDRNISTVSNISSVPIVAGYSSVGNSSSNLQPGMITNSLLPQMPVGYSTNLVSSGNRSNVPMMLPNSLTSGQPTINSAFPQMSATATSKQPQYCMMKMDGKDVLVQLVPSGISGQTPQGMQSVVLQGGKRFLIAPPAGMQGTPAQPRILGQSVVRRGPTPGLTQVTNGPISSNTRFMTATSLPNTMMNTSVHRNNIPMLSSAPLTRLTGMPVGQNFSLATSHALATTGGLSIVSPSMTTNASSAYVFTSANPMSASVRPSSNLTSMAAPNSTAVVQGVRALGPSARFPIVSTQSGQGNVTQVRVFVPGCTITGTRGHYSTLNTVSGSPLTRLTASSQLLPERKPPTDSALTPEQKAAKRKRLEKKYPLPPGVVIKTEPDSPPPSTSQTSNPGMRSLLGGQNISIIPSRVGGSSNVRIISPTLATAIQTRAVRPGSNIMYRAANVGRGQTVLVPLSVNSTAPTLVGASSISNSPSISSFTMVSTATTLTPSSSSPTCTTAATVSTTATLATTSTVSIIPETNTTSVTLTTTASSNSSLPNTVSQSNNFIPQSERESSSPAVSLSKAANIQTASSAVSQESSQAELDKLRKLVMAQEALGLKGQRLDKLKTLLRQKEEAMKTLKSSVITGKSVGGSASCTPVSNPESISSGDINGITGTETDPFVID